MINPRQTEKKTILVVEDSPTQAEIVRRILSREGYEILLAKNGMEGLEAAQKHRPDLVVGDIDMPFMDGYRMCYEIKTDDNLQEIPVLLLTKLGDSEDILRGLASRADWYLTKPFNKEYFVRKIKDLLQSNGKSSRALPSSFTQKFQLPSNQAEFQRILTILLSTYENAFHINQDLILTQKQLELLNKNLDDKVTERTAQLEKAQKQLIASEKLAGIGTLSASICHEIKNPLNIISIHVQLLLRKFESEPEMFDPLTKIQVEMRRIEKILNQLMSFVRTAEPDPRFLAINHELEETLGLMRKDLISSNIEIENNFCPDLPKVLADPDELRQVFFNLLINARYSMKNGGRLTVTTERVTKNQQYSARISLSDTGCGIGPEHLAKIFQPFFTTKPEGEGTGMGLYVCKNIIEKYGGSLIVQSGEAKGTTFIIDLPQTHS